MCVTFCPDNNNSTLIYFHGGSMSLRRSTHSLTLSAAPIFRLCSCLFKSSSSSVCHPRDILSDTFPLATYFELGSKWARAALNKLAFDSETSVMNKKAKRGEEAMEPFFRSWFAFQEESLIIITYNGSRGDKQDFAKVCHIVPQHALSANMAACNRKKVRINHEFSSEIVIVVRWQFQLGIFWRARPVMVSQATAVALKASRQQVW